MIPSTSFREHLWSRPDGKVHRPRHAGKSRDLQRLDQNSLAASRFRSLEIHRNTSPRRVALAPVVNHISCLQPRHFRDAEPAVERYQQRDCSTVATKEAHHFCERICNVQVHGSVRRGREKSVPASDAAARYCQLLERRVEMLKAVYRVSAVALSCAPRSRSLGVLEVNVMSQPVVGVVLRIKVLATLLYIGKKLNHRWTVPCRRCLAIDRGREKRTPKLRRPRVLCLPDSGGCVTTLTAAAAPNNWHAQTRARDKRPAAGLVGHVPVRRDPPADKLEALRDRLSIEDPFETHDSPNPNRRHDVARSLASQKGKAARLVAEWKRARAIIAERQPGQVARLFERA